MGWRDDPVEESLAWEQDPEAPPSVTEDIGYAAPSAAGRIPFAIAGAPAAFLGLGMEAGRGLDYAWQKYIQGRETPDVETAEQTAARNPLAHLTPQALEETFWEKPTGTRFYDPQTDPGKITAATITGAGAGALTGGGVGAGPAALVSGAATGAGGGAGAEYARQLAEGTAWETPATIAGGIAGGGAGQAVAAGLRKVVTPRNIPQVNKDLAGILKKEGIPNLTEGQLVQHNRRLLAAERTRVHPEAHIEQLEAVTAAALRRIGVNSKRATPEVMDKTFNEITAEYNRLGSGNRLVGDAPLGADLANTMAKYNRLVGDTSRIPAVANYRNEINDFLRGNNGAIDGPTYNSLRSRIQEDARSLSDPTARDALFDMTSALDDAMERSIVKNNPRDAGAFRTLKTRYRNILVVEDAIGRGTNYANLSLISPAALVTSTKKWHGERNWVRGQGPFADLARASGGLLRELEPTGQAPLRIPLSQANVLAMGPMAVKRGIDYLRMTRPAQKWLTNRLLQPPAGTAAQRTMTGAIPPLAAELQPNYSAVVNAINQGGGSSQIRPEILNDPRIQSVIDALGGGQ